MESAGWSSQLSSGLESSPIYFFFFFTFLGRLAFSFLKWAADLTEFQFQKCSQRFHKQKKGRKKKDNKHVSILLWEVHEKEDMSIFGLYVVTIAVVYTQ